MLMTQILAKIGSGVLMDTACRVVAADDTCDKIGLVGMTVVAVVTMTGGAIYYLCSKTRDKLPKNQAEKLKAVIEEQTSAQVDSIKID